MRYWDGPAWNDHIADSTAPAVAAESTSPADSPPEDEAPQQRDGKPHGRPVPPWSERLNPQGIVGESFHEGTLKSLAGTYGHRSIPDYGVELTDACAAIVRDPDNPYDSNAVAVWIDGEYLVGHLPRNVAAEFTPGLENLEHGTYLQVPARVWIGPSFDYDSRTGSEVRGTRGSVTVRLPEPDGIVPYNDLPDEPTPCCHGDAPYRSPAKSTTWMCCAPSRSAPTPGT